MSELRSCDVAIVGAGLSGLRAAHLLDRDGIDVLVLEAQDRVGGRTLTAHLDDSAFIDDGGQWVSPNQGRIDALASELNVWLTEVDLHVRHAGLTVRTRRCPRRAPSSGGLHRRGIDLTAGGLECEAHCAVVPCAT